MNFFKTLLMVSVSTSVLAGCAMIPDYDRPDMPVTAEWPKGQAYEGIEGVTNADISQVNWQSFFLSPPMQQVIQISLDNNRDLRVASLQVEKARALYRVERAALVPSVDAAGSSTRQGIPENASGLGKDTVSSNYSANLGATAFELDLFGRIRSLNEKALEEYFATEEAQWSTPIIESRI